jgi:hypothetical protein
MINEGLGAGKVDHTKDEKQLENPLSKKDTEPKEDKRDNSMTENFEDVQKLGKEMENMKTKKELKKEGLTSDPIQD